MQILHTPLTPARLPHWRQPEEGPVTYRPYPNADRALRQLDRHGRTVPEPSELRKQMAAQANTALAVMAEAAKPLRARLEAMGAPRETPLAFQMAFALDRQLKVELAKSAPGVLVMHEMVQQMRRRTA